MNTATTLALILAAISFPTAAPAGSAQSKAVNTLADRYYEFRLATQPEVAYFSGVEISRHDGLYDNSPQAIAREQANEDEFLRELGQIDETALRGGVDWITYGFLKQALTSARDLRVCKAELTPNWLHFNRLEMLSSGSRRYHAGENYRPGLTRKSSTWRPAWRLDIHHQRLR
jgi:uncharacterized protein (DUF885 family)